jgi:hypothetical protein
VDFNKEIKPIFEASCIKCHGRGKSKGGLQFDTRETFLKGGDSGAPIVPGQSDESLLISLVQGFDPDSVMPKKGSRLTSEQIGVLRAWIDQGAKWDSSITFGRLPPVNLKPREVAVPKAGPSHPVDALLTSYYRSNHITAAKPVDDRLFARRAYLDVTGLLPSPQEVERFAKDKSANKRAALVDKLLAENRDYAEHWMSFWNDMLRNDYKGTGYIDGGRKQITKWLFNSLLTNKPYNQFVAELINPGAESEGFTKGIVWRGVVNASQTPQMQAAQGICQVFMGVNLKCASCHDSFVNDLTLADAYGLAGIYANAPLEMVHCDKPTGKTADLHFVYPELGTIDPKASKDERLKQLADLITKPEDGRLTRTLVNRLWGRFMGRAFVEPVDDMEKPAWNPDLMDWLAQDFAQHSYDVKHLIRTVLTSDTYAMPAVNGPQGNEAFVFRGPLVRRMTAEQFRDALTSLTGYGYTTAAADVAAGEKEQKRFALTAPMRWIWDKPGAAERAAPGHVYFRRTIDLAATPTDATLMAQADNEFTVYVNGKKVGSGNDFKTAMLYDVRSLLKKGQNVIAIEAVNNRNDNSAPDKGTVEGQENPAGLLFYARVRDGGKKAHDFGSDTNWVATSDKIDGWEKAEQPKGNWIAATDLGDTTMIPWRVGKEYLRTRLTSVYPGTTRAALVAADPLMVALGRPNREQVVTTRPSEATTLQALEMTNGGTLADVVKRGATALSGDANSRRDVVTNLYTKALGRRPSSKELEIARELAGNPVTEPGVEDLIWTLAMLPEFQLIY